MQLVLKAEPGKDGSQIVNKVRNIRAEIRREEEKR